MNLLNVGAIGVWSQVKTANSSLISLQSLGLTTQNLSSVIVNQIMGFGVASQFMQNESVNILFLGE